MKFSKHAAWIVLVTGLMAGCANQTGSSPSDTSTVTRPATTSTGSAGSGSGVTGQPVDDAGSSGGSAAASGGGRCVDPQSSVVQNALASLPSFQGHGFVAGDSLDSRIGSCPQLTWVVADLAGGTGSSPQRVLFFGANGYLGPATDRDTAFTSVVDTGANGVAVQYKWLDNGDVTANPTGGPVVVRYSLKNGTVVADRDVPAEVFGGGGATGGTTDPTTPADTTTTVTDPAPCGTGDNATLQAVYEAHFGDAIAPPFTFRVRDCDGDWAIASVTADSDAYQGERALFRYSGEAWQAVTRGTGFRCRALGVPDSTADRLEC
ncbi:LppP/LprE family lipoprotein [Williamsia sterculiae]|uniref:LppP/LprE lipoprotein n=1 Tax=Williamsia sterculiae TaxID=1344003 RepID=A0A1N7FJJ0_9NOCA|nr:LppP/LprE family lipoprotein [Williamsia sterculiae]SIS00444.1 LppP/LprE lipoprotein [Williamsia sterculiae]